MTVWNEYSKLKSVMIGKRFTEDILRDRFKNTTKEKLDAIIKINNETNEDLDKIQLFLEQEGVRVYRPNLDVYWKLDDKDVNDPGACRDWCFTYGDLIILMQSSYHQRRQEYLFWEDTFIHLEKQGKIIIQFPQSCPSSTRFQKKERQFGNSLSIFEMKEMMMEFMSNIDDAPRNSNIINKFRNVLTDEIEDDYYTNDRKGWFEPYYTYLFSSLKTGLYNHAASYFKHDNIIYGSPLGTISGRRNFEKIIKGFYPNTNFIYNENQIPAHIDAWQNIVDKDFRVCSGYKEEDYVERDPDFFNIKTLFLNEKEWAWHLPERNKFMESVWSGYENYIEDLKGWDQRVDFDLNGLTYEPKKMIAGFFNKERLNSIQQHIYIKNIPMRHRYIVDGGIHCYTVDVDRYN